MLCGRARCGPLTTPIPGRRLQNAQFVAVRIREYVPSPLRLEYWFGSEPRRTEGKDPLHLALEVARPQIEVEPVLCRLALRHALQDKLDADSVCWHENLVGTCGLAGTHVAESCGPELGGAVKVGAVEHECQVTAARPVGMWLTWHLTILTPAAA